MACNDISIGCACNGDDVAPSGALAIGDKCFITSPLPQLHNTTVCSDLSMTHPKYIDAAQFATIKTLSGSTLFINNYYILYFLFFPSRFCDTESWLLGRSHKSIG